MKLKSITKIQSFSIDGKKVATMKLKFSFTEIITATNLLAGLNMDVGVLARLSSGEQFSLGVFKNMGTTFDKDGNSVVTLKSMTENINVDKIAKLLNGDEEAFQVMFKAVIQNEE